MKVVNQAGPYKKRKYTRKNKKYAQLFCLITLFNPRTYTQIHTPTVVQGGGWMEPSPRSFQYVVVFRNDFTFSGNTLIFLKR